jgi:hypothetical protein
MFWAFKLSFVVDVLAFLSWRQFGVLFEILSCFKPSGHPDQGPILKLVMLKGKNVKQ